MNETENETDLDVGEDEADAWVAEIDWDHDPSDYSLLEA
jgi:hypothetical protein